MIDPKAEMYIPGWLNTLHRESVSSDGSALKGVSCIVLLRDVDKFCGLGLRVWLPGVVVACHSGCFLGVAICKNVVQRCLAFRG